MRRGRSPPTLPPPTFVNHRNRDLPIPSFSLFPCRSIAGIHAPPWFTTYHRPPPHPFQTRTLGFAGNSGGRVHLGRKCEKPLASVQIRLHAHLHARSHTYAATHARPLPLTIRGSMNGLWAINGLTRVYPHACTRSAPVMCRRSGAARHSHAITAFRNRRE